jgi:hypothetical protein
MYMAVREMLSEALVGVPEPPAGGSGPERRKKSTPQLLEPMLTRLGGQLPQVPAFLSGFLPIPTRGFDPVSRLNPVGTRLVRFQARLRGGCVNG